MPLKRGQAAILSSLLLHSSGPNTTDGPRRAYVIQYAPTHAINPRSGEPWGDCLPVAKAGRPYDHDKLDRHLMRHPSGVKVLVGPTRPDHASAVTVDFLRDVYASVRTMCDVVIVDTPPGFTPEVIATIDVSTSAVLVGMLDSLSLKNTKLGLETLDLMGYPLENVSLILNRADSRVGITHDDVTAIVGRSPDVLIPSDREIPRSVNEGTPIVASRERSSASKSRSPSTSTRIRTRRRARLRTCTSRRRPTS